jgi:hypothetical protein
VEQSNEHVKPHSAVTAIQKEMIEKIKENVLPTALPWTPVTINSEQVSLFTADLYIVKCIV